MRKVLEPTGLYKQRQSYDFLWQFTDLNYKLKFVEGSGVMRYNNPSASTVTKS